MPTHVGILPLGGGLYRHPDGTVDLKPYDPPEGLTVMDGSMSTAAPIPLAADGTPRWNLDTHGQKFMDPWIMQRSGGYMPTGLEYLARVPQNGEARVDAMLAYVLGPSGDIPVPAAEVLAALGEVMRQRIDADALKTREAAWRTWDNLAKLYPNVYVYFIVAALKWFTTWVDPSNYGASAKAKAQVVGYLSGMLEQMNKSISTVTPYPWHVFQSLPLNIEKLRDAFKKVAPAVKSEAQASSSASSTPAKTSGTSTSGTSTEDSISPTDMSAMFTQFGTDMSEVVAEVDATDTAIDLLDNGYKTLRLNNEKFAALPETLQTPARAWWTAFLSSLDSSPDIKRVFNALPSGEWGAWNLASDEQVVVVAAGFAKVYDLPLRDLAVRLWNESPGWSGDPSLLSRNEYHESDPRGSPSNATQVQLGQLCVNAVKIARSMREAVDYGDLPFKFEGIAKPKASALGGALGSALGGTAPPPLYQLEAGASGAATGQVPLLLGALGAVGSILYGLALPWAAVPLIAGYLLSKPTKKATSEKTP